MEGKGFDMKILNIGGKEYKLEFSFEAAEYKDVVQKMFNVLSGAYYVVKNSVDADDETSAKIGFITGITEMVADIPNIVKTAFYAGLLEHHNLKEDEAKQLMRQYLKENKCSYNVLFEDIKVCMEEDGFFDLSGINEMIQGMNKMQEEVQTE